MSAYRGFIVLGAGVVLVLLPFLIFVAAGWPGSPDSCMAATPNTCFCEAFDPADVIAHARGVRQPVNTWFNLYSILTAGLVAFMIYLDRKDGARGENVMRSDNFIADLYVFAVLFLGLGSMWFHASIVGWAGNFDGLSMYVYAAFLVFYTLRRLVPADWVFWVFYPITVVVFLIIHALWQWEFKSLILIIALVAAYLALEIVACVREGKPWQGRWLTILLWWLAVGCIIAATVFWALSQTGEPMCHPKDFFQPHGMLWHPLAGAMAVLLYFYWREENRT
jgi:hypothetical protein